MGSTIDAGARVLTVSSYAVTPQRLAAHRMEDDFEALQTSAVASGRPVWAAFTLADEPIPEAPRLRSGEPLEAGVRVAAELGAQAILLNCSRPEAFDAALPDLVRRFPRVGAYANGFTSVSGLHDAGTVDALESRVDLGPDAYAHRALAWADAGAQIVGGCCEVGPAHIDALRRALLNRGEAIASSER